MSKDVDSAARQSHYTFFSHTDCEYFPCHKTDNPGDFNCMFCYCPLYALGEDCGGNYKYIEGGVKDCSDCLLPHRRDSAPYIWSRFDDLMRLAAKKEA